MAQVAARDQFINAIKYIAGYALYGVIRLKTKAPDDHSLNELFMLQLFSFVAFFAHAIGLSSMIGEAIAAEDQVAATNNFRMRELAMMYGSQLAYIATTSSLLLEITQDGARESCIYFSYFALTSFAYTTYLSIQETHQGQTDEENNAGVEQTRDAINIRSNREWKIFHSVLTLGTLYQVFTHSNNSNVYNLTLNAFTLIEGLLNAGLIATYNSTSNPYFTLALSTQTAFHLVNRNAKEFLSAQLGSYYQMAATGINMSLAAFAVIQFFRSQIPRAKKLAAAIHQQPNRHTA